MHCMIIVFELTRIHDCMQYVGPLITDFSYNCTLGFLGLSDLRRVQNTLWDARTQWYNLGLDLDISPDSLDSIELANAGNPERCFRAMLTKWLREYHRPTWSALAEALKSPSVGLSHLAEEINS